MVFSTKNAISKNIQFNEIIQNNSEKKEINQTEFKDEVKIEEINLNKIREEEPNQQVCSQRCLVVRKGIIRPKFQTSIEDNNKVI